jgi:tRNA modification GTPase
MVDPDGGQFVDEAVVSVRRSPRSFTGEDTVEICTHGGRAVVMRMMSILASLGARPASPGEFTMRAFLNGRIDLARAEAVAQMVAAEGKAQLECAASALRGALSQEISAVYDPLMDVLAGLEAHIEFPEDGAPAPDPAALSAALEGSRAGLARLAGSYREGRLVSEGARVVIAGRPNAGKSSLFNALCGEERAIVTEMPGTTRDAIECMVEWDGFPVRLHDTAGLRESGDIIEMLGVKRAAGLAGVADAIIYLLDGGAGIHAGDIESIKRFGPKTVVALGKSDLPGSAACEAPEGAVRCSALTRSGLDELKAAVLRRLELSEAGGADAVMVTNSRHHALLCVAVSHLDNAIAGLPDRAPLDIVASDLRLSMESLGAITGANITEETLESVFSRFCVGK